MNRFEGRFVKGETPSWQEKDALFAAHSCVRCRAASFPLGE